MIRCAALCALILVASCGARLAAPAGSGNQPPELVLAGLIEQKGCQLGPVRAQEAREEMGIDVATYDALIQKLVDQDRASLHSGGQVELMSEVCI